MLRYVSIPARVLSLAILFLAGSVEAANRIILIKTVASEEYVKQRAEGGPEEIQTYNFFKGRFFAGKPKDRSLERFTFRDIVVDMAVHLQKQGYQVAVLA